MIFLQWAFDATLAGTLLWLAWQVLASEDLFRGIVLFIAFGLLMALAWVRLDAPDIALAEAAIGAGLTGALLLAALAKLDVANDVSPPLSKSETVPAETAVLFRLLLVLLLFGLTVGLAFALLELPLQAGGLSLQAAENIAVSGVSNPVTAVLLNFRAYDTLLEMAVLFLAVLAVWSLAATPGRSESAPGAVLDMLSRLLVPLLVLVSGYLLWLGGHAAGGAFQAGAVLAAAGVLLLLTGYLPGERFSGWPLRLSLVLGLAVFIVVALVLLLFGGNFLAFPPPFAGDLILLIEAAAALSIGITLAALFFGRRPRSEPSSADREESEKTQ